MGRHAQDAPPSPASTISGSKTNTRENKLVVLGAGGVGKTSLVVQFLEGFFAASYKPTVEDYYRHTIQMPDGIFHTVEILDTAGSHHFPAMRELSIRSGRGFVLVFSVDSLQSFHEAIQLWELIARIRGTQVPLILVGNKSDLVTERQVSEELVQQTSNEMLLRCCYIETSAKYNVNVSQLFIQLLQQAKAMEEAAAAELAARRPSSRRLSRRLSSFGSLPAWTIRRKSSTTKLTEESELPRPQDNKCVLL